ALHHRLRARRSAMCARRRDARTDPRRAGRHGREHPDPRLRRDRDRRHRLDPRRLRRRAARRHRRHERTRVPAGRVFRLPAAAAGERRRTRHRVGVDLRADGRGALFPAAGPVPGTRMKRALLVFLVLAIFPLAMQALDAMFYVSLASRILIYAIAATSLNLVLGYGGMVSFGHASFFGAGASVLGILALEGVPSAWIAWPAAVAVAALAALAIGAMSLRTRGVYFIMITLAFAQMIYYIFVSLKTYGGDDGLSMPGRSTVGLGANLR